ncbi:MAG: ABC transporter substrate-binding protein [Candidatus Thorarchaeota archaeon]|jgi:ABC-type transport system substrate-binding protein
MRLRYLIVVFLFCVLFTFTSVHDVSAEPSELKFDDTISGPYVNKVLYKIITGENNQVQALLNNEIDILDGPIGVGYLPTLDADPNISLSSTLRNGYGHITINCRDAPLNWTALRRAFALAYNKTKVQSDIFQNYSRLQDSLVPYTNDLFCVEDELPHNYYTSEIALGNALLDSAGFLVDGGTGFREDPNGNPIHIVIAYSASSPTIAGGCAQIGVDALNALSISASTNAADFNTYIANMYNHGAYDMIFYATDFYSNDVSWLASQYWSDNDDVYAQNPSNFANSTYDLYRDQLINGTTYQEVYNASREMQKILHHNVPVLVVYEDFQFSAYRTDRFEGHVLDVSQNIGNEWTNLKSHLTLLEGGPFSGTLRVSMGQEPDTFNTMTTNSKYSKTIFRDMFNSLLRTGPDGDLRLDLAESYTIETHDDNLAVPDGNTRITFEVIQNALWSDGTPLTAHDIAYTFNFYLDSLAFGNPTGVMLQDIASVFAPTTSRVVIEFSSESYSLIERISDVIILQRTLLENIGPSNWHTWNPVFSSDPYPTSGPFNITDNAPGEYVELSYRPLFHNGVRGTGSDIPSIEDMADFSIVDSPYIGDLTWDVTDDNPLVYRIYHNETLLEASYYDQSPIGISLDGYNLGPHNFTVVVQDYEYQNATDKVTVTLIPDTFVPEINGSILVELYEGSTVGSVLDWDVFDHNPGNYTLDVNGTEIVSDTWDWGTNRISYSLGDLTIANYTYTLTVRDTLGHSSDWMILVSVSERPPSFALESLILIVSGAAVVVVIGVIVMKKRR